MGPEALRCTMDGVMVDKDGHFGDNDSQQLGEGKEQLPPRQESGWCVRWGRRLCSCEPQHPVWNLWVPQNLF